MSPASQVKSLWRHVNGYFLAAVYCQLVEPSVHRKQSSGTCRPLRKTRQFNFCLTALFLMELVGPTLVRGASLTESSATEILSRHPTTLKCIPAHSKPIRRLKTASS